MDARLNTLDPSGRAVAFEFVNYARQVGIPVVVTSARRTAQQQLKLIPAAGLYKADPATSRHVQGRAFDLAIAGFAWQEVPDRYWRWLGAVWKGAGGRWGGDFRRPDPIHFDW